MSNAFIQDLRFAFRWLLASPAFACVAILTLAVAIGANTAIVTVVRQALLDPIPMQDAHRLFTVESVSLEGPEAQAQRGNFSRGVMEYVSGPVYQQLVKETEVFHGVSAYRGDQLSLMGESYPELVWGYNVTANFFSTLGVKPQLGRTFARDDAPVGAGNVVVLSHRFWQRQFGGDTQIIGRSIPLSNELQVPSKLVKSVVVIGIMPPDFQFPRWSEDSCSYWIATDLAGENFSNPWHWRMRNWTAVARLKESVAPEQTQAVLNRLAELNAQEQPEGNAGFGLNLRPLRHLFVSEDFSGTITALSGAVAFVLLIACANVAGLLLSRLELRQQELTLRAALGATRGRLARQLLTESLLLALLGGMLGWIASHWFLDILKTALPPQLPRLRELTLDSTAFAANFLIAGLSGMVFGLIPVLRSSNPQAGEMLRESGHGVTQARRGRWIQGSLLVTQVALTIILLCGAGLMIQSIVRLMQVNPGYEPQNLLGFMATHFNVEPGVRDAKLRDLSQRLEAVPGVESLSIATTRGRYEWIVDEPANRKSAWFTRCTTDDLDHLRNLRIPLLAGRYLTDADAEGQERGAVINQTMARAFWPDEEPLGKLFTQFREMQRPNMPPPLTYRVVGVAGDVKPGPEEQAEPEFYTPYLGTPEMSMDSQFHLRRQADATALVPLIRHIVWQQDPKALPAQVWDRENWWEHSVASRQTYLQFLAFFGGVGLLLSAIGIYAVTSQLVTRRAKEIGLRMALGAGSRDVFRMILGRTASLSAVGFVIGVVGVLGLQRFLQSQLFGVQVLAPLNFLTVGLVLAVIALGACLPPIRRALRTDPASALREQ